MDVEGLVVLVCRTGLQSRVDELPARVVEFQQKGVERLLKTWTVEEVREAAIHGMPRLWPFSEGGVWDVADLGKNIAKAVTTARKGIRTGTIPMDASLIPDPE